MALAWRELDLREDPDAIRYEGDPADLIDAADLLLALASRPAWHRQAACRGQGVDRWFPGRGQPIAPATAVCAGCPVQVECLRAGMAEGAGIWGGSSERGRRRLRRGDLAA